MMLLSEQTESYPNKRQKISQESPKPVEVVVSTTMNVQNAEKHKEIPGFYFDVQKNRYFKIDKFHKYSHAQNNETARFTKVSKAANGTRSKRTRNVLDWLRRR